MAFKCVNELDKFMFQDAEVKKMELNPGLMTMVLLGVAAKHNNPSNDTLTDRYLDDTELRFKSPVITRFLLEGAKYYDANNVLQREVPDQDIPEEQFKEIPENTGRWKSICSDTETCKKRWRMLL